MPRAKEYNTVCDQTKLPVKKLNTKKYKNKHDRLYILFVLSLKKKTCSINSI